MSTIIHAIGIGCAVIALIAFGRAFLLASRNHERARPWIYVGWAFVILNLVSIGLDFATR